MPLHHNLPEERPQQRRADGRIRIVGYVDGGGEAEEGEGGREGEGGGGGGGGGEGGGEIGGEIGDEIEDEVEIVISLGQLFFANYYSFLTDALARLVLARDALPPSQAARLVLTLTLTPTSTPTPTPTLSPTLTFSPTPTLTLAGCAAARLTAHGPPTATPLHVASAP